MKQTSLGATGAAAFAAAASGRQALGANERLAVGVIGCGGRGRGLAREFAHLENVRVTHVCDADASRAEKARQAAGAERVVPDMRQILDEKSVDAVVIATPDDWHAPAAILACEAGKHVYVEKPCSHNIREGRLMVEAARHHKRVMQVGTQSRSAAVIQKGIQKLHEGVIGQVLVAKAWDSQRRANIGHRQPSDPPPGCNYDLWVGPAAWMPFQSNRFHYTWHWWYNFGTGDIGNDGVHDIDIARWGLGVETHPSIVSGHGSKLHFDDDQQFPDTQYITYEYPGDGKIGSRRLLVYEQRIWSPYRQEGHENGNAFYGTEGVMVLGKKDGWQIFGPRNKLIAEEKGGYNNKDHALDFVEAIHSGGRPNADIEIGHLSATLSHLGNIVSRVGRTVRFDPKTEQITGDEEANRLVRREYRKDHWAVPKGVY